jgi:beta-glucosidase
MRKRLQMGFAVALALGAVAAPAAAAGCAAITEPKPLADWPRLVSPWPRDAALEARIADILAGMTLRQKIGQMTQPEIQSITPDEVRRHHIGSVLSGGGSWPGKRKQAAPADWLALADAYWDAAMRTDAKVKVPLLWGIDAVHGHGNVRGATLFPHNIGLGAARDPCLLRRIGAATAQQLRVTGQDWNFAPTLAVVRDDRWGRSYEGYSEHPAIVQAYAGEIVAGLQGSVPAPGIVATAKHFIGDGGTARGVDQGITAAAKEPLVNLHAPGYVAALGAGVQSVMVSFSSWADPAAGGKPEKLHGHRALITEVLKGRLGFDGIVVSDWNGHGQVPGCSDASCAAAILAGIDVFMVPEKWRQFIENSVEQVEKGDVPMARIDDAVRRILRVKLRAGLFEAPRPTLRPGAGRAEQLLHRELAREAVQKSLVLLKNERGVLPLARGRKVLVVGRGADSLPMQTGGWSVTWQGNENTNADFPQGTSVLAGIRQAAGEANVAFDMTARGIDVKPFDAVIAVIGETPYAEGQGDIHDTTLAHAQRHATDLALLERVSGRGVPVVTVLLSGRPLHVNKELNRSDAFVAAWLPGTEGQGIADLLFRRADGTVDKDFVGKLPFSWPAHACQTPLNVGDAGYKPLFPYGHGASYAEPRALGRLEEPAVPPRCD